MSSTKFNIKTYTPHTIYGFSTKVYEKKNIISYSNYYVSSHNI